LMTRSLSAPPSEEEVRRNPSLSRFHQLRSALPLSFMVRVVIAVSS